LQKKQQLFDVNKKRKRKKECLVFSFHFLHIRAVVLVEVVLHDRIQARAALLSVWLSLAVPPS